MNKLKFLTISIILAMTLSLAGPSLDVSARPLAVTAQINLLTTSNFAVLAGSAVNDMTPLLPSLITGNVGLSPSGWGASLGPLTCAEVTGKIYSVDVSGPLPCRLINAGLLTIAKNDLTTAYNNTAARPTTATIATELGGVTLTDGVYDSAAGTFGITGAKTLTLNGAGNPDSVFIFQMATTLITGVASKVVLTGGAQSCNVYWQVGSSATLGTGSQFVGTVMADQSITDNGGSTVDGRFLARIAAVTLRNTHIAVSLCNPTITTTLSASNINIGSAVHDTAVLHGATANAGGTVHYSVYSDNACTLKVNDAGTKPVTNHIVTDSDPITFPTAGTFYWQAVYSGDSANNDATSACTSEVLVVVNPLLRNVTITTLLSASKINIGSAVRDSAVLHGATATAGGTVTYTKYSDSACTLNPQVAGTKTVTNGIVPDSDPITFPTAGTFYWRAIYSGDANNNGATSACTSEVLIVINPLLRIVTITTTLSSGSVAVGSGVRDSSVLHGATATAGGTVTYSVYSDNACTLNARVAGTKTVTNSIVPDSDPITFNTVGTYYWLAIYSGDAANNGATSACTSEVLVVTVPAPVPPVPPVLPPTGFNPQRVTVLSAQPPEKAYAALGDLWLEIPRLSVQMPIVGVPQADGTWDISWLGNSAGWLQGTAFPTYNGNSVITGHVWNANNTAGPFVSLNTLWYGDHVIVHAWGQQYIYEVRSVMQVRPDSTIAAFQHRDTPWVTLTTCQSYDESKGTYRYRVLVLAALVDIK